MKPIIPFLYLTFLPILSYSQENSSTPTITIKANMSISAIHGTYYETLRNSITYQHALGLGVVVKNWFYIGGFTSSYTWFREIPPITYYRDIRAIELGLPINNKHLAGIIYGKEEYTSSSQGGTQAFYLYDSPLYGIFFDYRICKFLSVPLKISTSNDGSDYGFGRYWHFSVGATGNLPVPLSKYK